MTKKFIAGGCSFTFGNELSDDVNGDMPSAKTWAYGLCENTDMEYVCTAFGGLGNQAIARRVFMAINSNEDIGAVAVMWSFPSRYDWAMPEFKKLDGSRWVSVSPWDTRKGHEEAMKKLADSDIQQEIWQKRSEETAKIGLRDFADSLYKNAANEYHEIYLSWKSITWLQNILEKRNIPFFFTLADNTLSSNRAPILIITSHSCIAMFASYIPCIPNMPNEFLSDEATTPKPINVIVTGDPVKSINSLTNFDAFGPEFMQPPPI